MDFYIVNVLYVFDDIYKLAVIKKTQQQDKHIK